MNLKASIDITGMRSGRLVAVAPTDKRYAGSVLWRCKCDCGKEKIVPAYKIKAGLIQSCGCARRQKNMADLTGQRFGKLTAIRRTDKKRGSSYLWECVCDCGNTILAPTGALRSGNTKSCGCLRVDQINKTIETHGTVADHVHHIDGTVLEKLCRAKPQANNTTGYTGVQQRGDKYIATIGFKGHHYYLGIYTNIEDAIRARQRAEEEIHRPFLEQYFEQEEESEK